jgi:hypothetical protein
MARKFFFIGAGILCLALAYNLGARSATAQAVGLGAPGIFWTYGGYTYWTGAVNRSFVWAANAGNSTPHTIPDPIPGTSPVAATMMSDYVTAVLLANGDMFTWNGAWQFKGNLVAQATPAAQETWGSVKARYRPGAPATRQ